MDDTAIGQTTHLAAARMEPMAMPDRLDSVGLDAWVYVKVGADQAVSRLGDVRAGRGTGRVVGSVGPSCV